MYYILDHSFDSIIKLSSLLMFCLSFVAETNANAILHFFLISDISYGLLISHSWQRLTQVHNSTTVLFLKIEFIIDVLVSHLW